MKANLPNLELLEYQALQILHKDERIRDAVESHWKKKGYKCFEGAFAIELSAYMFPQTWGSTSTAFDIDKHGNPTMGGSAVTKAYTVVFYEEISDTYLVFVNGQFAYLVWNPTKAFFEDLDNMAMCSVSQANDRY